MVFSDCVMRDALHKVDSKIVTPLGVAPMAWIDLAVDCPFSLLNESDCPETCIWRESNAGRDMWEV